ncbi:MAG: ABC transporter permease [Treponema sp.]|nr:ABC transporter permease [Treponema sp.]
MNPMQLFQSCLRSIFRNRMRSLLTSLGIIIGVGSVIVMVALGEGSRRVIEQNINALGTNLLQATPRPRQDRVGNMMMMRQNSFTPNDVHKLREESSFLAAVSGVTTSNTTVIGPVGNAQVQVLGVEPEFSEIRNFIVGEGLFFDYEDLELRNRVAVLGKTTAETLFGQAENAMYQQIRIGREHFTVVGLLEPRGGMAGGADPDNIVLIPLDTAMTRLSNSRNINSIVMSVASQQFMTNAQTEASLILAESRGITNIANADFAIMNQADMLDMASATTRTLTTLLAMIAGVSLLVGGIGIMNIMLVSVTERTREIGIRMAVGGRKRDILFQFLSEAVILSLMGGALGIGLAFLAGSVLSSMGVPSAISPVVVAGSALFAAIVGVIFGYYPALKAARLYPIDALRYE